MFTFGERNNLLMLSQRQHLFFWGISALPSTVTMGLYSKHLHSYYRGARAATRPTRALVARGASQGEHSSRRDQTTTSIQRSSSSSLPPLPQPLSSENEAEAGTENKMTQKKPLELVVTLWVLQYIHLQQLCYQATWKMWLFFVFFEEKEGQVRVNEFNVRRESRRGRC